MNHLIYVAAAVDPRFKFGFVKYALTEGYGEKDGSIAGEGCNEQPQGIV